MSESAAVSGCLTRGGHDRAAFARRVIELVVDLDHACPHLFRALDRLRALAAAAPGAVPVHSGAGGPWGPVRHADRLAHLETRPLQYGTTLDYIDQSYILFRGACLICGVIADRLALVHVTGRGAVGFDSKSAAARLCMTQRERSSPPAPRARARRRGRRGGRRCATPHPGSSGRLLRGPAPARRVCAADASAGLRQNQPTACRLHLSNTPRRKTVTSC